MISGGNSRPGRKTRWAHGRLEGEGTEFPTLTISSQTQQKPCCQLKPRVFCSMKTRGFICMRFRYGPLMGSGRSLVGVGNNLLGALQHLFAALYFPGLMKFLCFFKKAKHVGDSGGSHG